MGYLLTAMIFFLATSFVLAALLGMCWIRYRRLQRELEEKLHRSAQLDHFLHDIAEVFETNAREKVIYRTILGGAHAVLRADAAGLYRVESATGTRRLVPCQLDANLPPLIALHSKHDTNTENDSTATNFTEIDLQKLHSLQLISAEVLGEGILGKAALASEPQFIEDLGQKAELDQYPAKLVDGWSVLLAPLQLGDSTEGLLVMAREPISPAFEETDLGIARSVAEHSAYALQSISIHAAAAERQTLRADIQRAALVQQVLVPPKLPSPPGWKLALHSSPARILSGDFYDICQHSAPVLIVADVCGKGLGSALLGAMTRSSLRLAVKETTTLGNALKQVNSQLHPDIREDMHVTLTMTSFAESGEVSLVRAGHEAPLLFRCKTSTVEELVPKGISLGIDSGVVFDRTLETTKQQLEPGDLLVFYTDGVTESVNSLGEEFGTQRLLKQLRMHGLLGAEGFLQALGEAHSQFVEDQSQVDDITLVVLEKEAPEDSASST